MNPKLVEKDSTSHERKCIAGKGRNSKRPKMIAVQIPNNEQGTLLVKRQDPVVPTHYLLTTCRYSRAVSQGQIY
jgi:hypothetical protein